MDLSWKHESPAQWDDDKARLIGGAPAGVFDVRFGRCSSGDLLPGDWWVVREGERVVGYGWWDTVWGDAEVNLVTAPEDRGRGIGRFIVDHLAEEAQRRGINYLYNTVRPSHPEHEKTARWIAGQGFVAGEDGSLFRSARTREAEMG